MTWREVITKAIAKQLTWVQAKRFWASALAICAAMAQGRRLGHVGGNRQRGARLRRKRIKAGTIELLCRIKRDVYPDFLLRHFYNRVSEKHGVKDNWLRLMMQDELVQKEPVRGGIAGTSLIDDLSQ
jgi:hypothetical protein